MRFKRPKPDRVQPVSLGLRLKLWLLLGMLAMVGMMMQHLQQPATVEKLGRLFSLEEQASPVADAKESPIPEELDFRENRTAEVFKVGASSQKREGEEASIADNAEGDDTLESLLENVEDNALFLKSEEEAWLAVLDAANKQSSKELANASIGQLAYAQLIEQPKVYRGKVVTLQGTVLREEELAPVKNELGIETFHRLVINPAGGGQWPFVVYALALSEEFPRGEPLREPVTVHGYFFKNWSYPHEEGYGLAPIVVANSIEWQPRSVASSSTENLKGGLPPWWAIAGVGAAALGLVSFLAWNTRRVSTAGKAREAATAASLKLLAEQESGD